MSQFSNHLENAILESSLRGAAFPVPTNVFLALFTSDPTDAGLPANEVQTSAWPAYARQNVAQGGPISSGWTAASNGTVTNAKTFTFPAHNGASPVTVTHIGLYDAATNGNLLYHAPLQTAKTLQVTDVLGLAIGALTVTVS